MDLDSTAALLSSNLPVGGDPSSVKKKSKSSKKSSKDSDDPEIPVEDLDSPNVPAFVDDDEDEVFFGEKTDKEVYGKNSK